MSAVPQFPAANDPDSLETQEWLDAKDAEGRKKVAAAIQQENYAQVPTVTLGQFQIPTAYRKSLAGKLEATGPLFWNVKRT